MNDSMILHQCKPKPFELVKGSSALVMIDMQRDFIMKGGYGYLQCHSDTVFNEVSKIIEPCKAVLEAARKLGMTIIHTREGHEPDLRDLPPSKKIRQYSAKPENYSLLIGDEGPMGRLLVRNEYGHDIVDELKPLPTEIVIDKPGKGTFYNTDIHQVLVTRGITHLLICGVTTECCVATTFREANDHGFECCALTDCTNGFDKDIVRESLNTLCAYDGLLGYVGSGSELVKLASEHAPKSLTQSAPINSFLNEIQQTESGPVYPTSFSIDNSVSDTSNLVKSIISKGGKLLGTIDNLDLQNGSFVIAVNDGTLKSNYPLFTPSTGMLSLEGTNHTMFGSISIVSKTLQEARYVFANERWFDPEDELSKPFNQYPIRHTDFRGIRNNFKYSTMQKDLNIKIDGRGQEVSFDWNLFQSVIDHEDLLKAELTSISKMEGFIQVESKYIDLLKKQKQIFNSFQPVDSPDVLICKWSTEVDYIVRLLGLPLVAMNGLLVIAEQGLDGVLLDICETIEECCR